MAHSAGAWPAPQACRCVRGAAGGVPRACVVCGSEGGGLVAVDGVEPGSVEEGREHWIMVKDGLRCSSGATAKGLPGLPQVQAALGRHSLEKVLHFLSHLGRRAAVAPLT